MEQIDHHDEIQLLQRLVVKLRARRLAAEDVGGLDPGRLDRVGLAALHLVDHHVGLAQPRKFFTIG